MTLPMNEWAKIAKYAQNLTGALLGSESARKLFGDVELPVFTQQRDLADAAQMSHGQIGNMKRGTSFGIESVCRLLTVTPMSLHEFVNRAITTGSATHAAKPPIAARQPFDRALARLSGLIDVARAETLRASLPAETSERDLLSVLLAFDATQREAPHASSPDETRARNLAKQSGVRRGGSKIRSV
jgi:hypothetical protein